MIENIFKSRYSLSILRILTKKPDAELYQAEIATTIKVNVQTVGRVLKELVDANLVIENRERGKLVFYKVNKSHPLIKALMPLFENWDNIEDFLTKSEKK